MANFKCKKCNNIFSVTRKVSTAKCNRCGALTTFKISQGEVISQQHRTKKEFDYATQNFQCLDCSHNFQLYVNHPRHAKICPRCRGSKLKPMSPVAYVHQPGKNKKANKHSKFLTNWNQNYDKLKKALEEIEYIDKQYNTGCTKEVKDVKEKMLDSFTQYRDGKLGTKGK